MAEQSISTREFLSPRYWLNLAEQKEQEDLDTIDSRVAEAIEQFLGLKKQDVRLFLRPGNHVLGAEHVRFINENNINHVSGEIGVDSLLYYLNPDYRIDAGFEEESIPEETENSLGAFESLKNKLRRVFVRMKNPTVGSTTSQYDIHKTIIETLFEKGFSLSSIDGDTTALYEDREVPAHLISASASGLIAVLLGVSALSKLGHTMTRREFLQKTAKTTAALGMLSFASWIGSTVIPIPTPLKRSKLFETGVDKQISFEELQSKLKNIDPMLGEFTHIFVKRRNEIMALNTWHIVSQTTVANAEQQNRILSYFGYGHGEIIDEFVKGPEVLTKQIENFAKELCTTGVQQMIQERTTADPDEYHRVTIVEVAPVLYQWSKLFADTALFGKNVEINEDTVENAPENARAIFLRVLHESLQTLEEKEKDVPVKSIELQVLFEALKLCIADIHELPQFVQTVNTNERVIEKPEEILRAKDVITGYEHKIKTAVEKTVGTVLDGGVHAVISGVHIFRFLKETPPFELNQGVWKHNGEFVPFKTVIKQIADDRIETQNEITLKNGVKKIVNKRVFTRLNGENDPRISQLVLEPRIDLEISLGLDSFSQSHYQLSLIAKSKAEVPGVWGDWSAYVAEDDTDEVFGIKVISHNVDHI